MERYSDLSGLLASSQQRWSSKASKSTQTTIGANTAHNLNEKRCDNGLNEPRGAVVLLASRPTGPSPSASRGAACLLRPPPALLLPGLLPPALTVPCCWVLFPHLAHHHAYMMSERPAVLFVVYVHCTNPNIITHREHGVIPCYK